MNAIIKSAKRKETHTPKFWWTQEVEIAWNDKKAARTRFNKSGSMQDLIELKRKEAIFNRKKKQSSQERFKEFIQSFNPQSPSRVIWNGLRRIAGKRITIENVLVHEDLQMAMDFLSKHFAENDHEQLQPCFFPNYNVLTVEFWNKFLAKKTKRSAPGPDGVTYNMLTLLQPEVRDSLIRDLNVMWKTNNIPRSLKLIKIIAIPG